MPKIPIDYSNTIIYKIVCKDLNVKDLYVGSTTDFRRRKSKHKDHCTHDYGKQHYKIYKAIKDNGGWNNWDMIEIEKYPCVDGNEARSRERYWLEHLQANLNKTIPSRTRSEYRLEHIEQIKERDKKRYENKKEHIKTINKINYEDNIERNQVRQREYYDKNKDFINEKAKQHIICVCGCSIRKSDKAKHMKTNKHLKLLEILKN